MTRRGGVTTAAILAALALAVMLPRLLSAQFGLLDDGVTIYVAQSLGRALGEGDPGLVLRLELERGRFRPFYWVFQALQYAIWGPRPLAFFIANGLALLVTALCVAGTVTVATRDRVASLLAAVAFVIAPPVVECYYTLSKPEVPLALWLGLSLWAWAGARVAAERRPRQSRRLLLVSAVSLLLAYFTKETAQTMLLVSALWVAAAWMSGGSSHPSVTRVDRWYFGANLAWTALFWMVRLGSGTAPVGAGDDSRAYALTSASIVSSALGHLVWYARDFGCLLPLLAFLAWLRAPRTRADPWLVMVPLLWIPCWTLVMLPWPTIYEYYLLPASLGVALVTGVSAASALRALRASDRSVRIVAAVVLTLALLCLPPTLANAVTNARIQLAVDRANADLIDFLAAGTPPGATVRVDLPTPNEYVHEVLMHLTLLKGRRDIDVGHRDQPSHVEMGAAFVATPYMLNRPRPGVRVPVSEGSPLRGTEAARQRFGPSAVLVHQVGRRVPLLVTPVPDPMCRLLARAEAHANLFCASRGRLLDRRVFRYGWEVYRVGG